MKLHQKAKQFKPARSILHSKKGLLLIIVFAVAGSAALLLTRAAAVYPVIESNLASVSSGAVKGTDSTAAFVQFKAPDTCPAGQTGTPPNCIIPTPASIYWGAYLDGDQDTYDYYYPGQRPGGPYPGVTGWTDAPWDLETWNKFEVNAGKKVSLIAYGQPPPWLQTSLDTVAFNNITSRGAIPFLSTGRDTDDLQTMINGGYDTSIKTWATNIKNYGKPFMFRPWWEMNGSWFGWGKQAAANPQQYVDAWQHWHDVVVAQGATNVTWVWCPNLEFAGTTSLNALYPGDAYVDWTCIDGYNWGPKHGDPWRSFSDLYKPTYDHILSIAPNKPVVIGEWGSEEAGGDKAVWLTDMLITQLPQNFPKIKAVAGFNWRISEGGQRWEWPIESSAAATSAFRAGISSSYYAGNNYGNLPPLSKVNPL